MVRKQIMRLTGKMIRKLVMNFPGRKDNGEKEKGFLVQVNLGYDMRSIVYSESDYVQEILSKKYTC